MHTCVASVLVDLSESKEDQPQVKDDDDEYDHSDVSGNNIQFGNSLIFKISNLTNFEILRFF